MQTYEINAKNKYWSLYEKLRGDILEGRLKKGERLPSKRALAESLSVSVVTVQSAYEQLLAEGYIYSRERSGYFVSDLNVEFYGRRRSEPVSTPPEKKFRLDLVKGTASSLFPFATWARLMRSVLSDCGEHLLERVPCDGDFELKCAVASYLYRARGIDVDPRYVVIGAGAEYLYGVIVQLLGRDKLFAVENPGYNKISQTYILNGARCVYIPVGDGGVDCKRAEESGADVLHISPSHQFPTGAVTPAASRARLIGWANAGGRYVVEDDYDSEFRLSGKPLQSTFSLCPDRVIYMNTFSKSLAPSMRMGYMVLPPELYEKYLALFSHSANVVPLFEQKTLAKMLDGGFFERHINRLKNHYRAVRQAVLEKAAEFKNCKIKDTGSGLHILVSFDGASDKYMKERAAAMGINLKCLSDYLLEPLEGREGWAVINYTGLTPQAVSEINL
ncbi:MAG: PLP-dependent aminotransferase family protein [Clostridia bacterium]|nr:PLP-dependent aminotransferase family protein [Clostridia bacterium]